MTKTSLPFITCFSVSIWPDRTEEASSELVSSQFYTQGPPRMKAVDGEGQVCPLLVQIKILRVGEGAPKDKCCWVSEERTCPLPTRGPVQGRFGDWKTEKYSQGQSPLGT